MNPFKFLVSCFLLQHALAGDLMLKSGDRFAGALSGMDEDTLVLETPWSPRPVIVPRREASQIILPETGRIQAEPRKVYVFRNGDRIHGNMVSVDGEAMKIETVWGKTLRLRRDRLQAVHTLPASPLADALASDKHLHLRSHQPGHAPKKIAGEIVTSRAVRQSIDLALRDLPPKFLVDFQTRHATDAPRYRFSILSSRDPEETGTRLFALSFRMGQLVYQEHHQATQLGGNWNQDLPPDLGRVHAARVYVDQEAERVHFFLNGRFIREWPLPASDSRGRDATPRAVRIEPRSHDLLALEKFQVLPWNGNFTHLPDAPDQTLFVLNNGDVLQGELTGFTGERHEIQLEEGRTVSLPKTVVSRILFPNNNAGSPETGTNLLLRSATSGMRLQASGAKMNNQHLEAGTPNFFETVHIPLEYLGYLLFR